MTHPYHDLDTYKEATPVIPALTRLWRIGCAFKLLPIGSAIYAILVTFILVNNGWFKLTGNLSQDVINIANRFPLVALIYFVFFIVFPIIVYDRFSVPIYRWLYSRGRDH